MAFRIIVLALLGFIASVQAFAIHNDQKLTTYTAGLANSLLEQLEHTEDLESNTYAANLLARLSDVFPAPDKALLQFKSTVDDSIHNATSKLQGLTNELANQARTVVRQANVTLHQEATSLVYEVGVLEEGCRAVDIDPTPCTEGKDGSIQKLPSQYSDKLQECEGDKVKQGESLISSAVKNVKNALAEVQRFSDDLKLCDKQKGVRIKLCRARVGTNIVEATEALPVEISKVVTDAMQLINTVYSEVQICTVTVNTDFLNHGKQIIDGIERCIDAQIHF